MLSKGLTSRFSKTIPHSEIQICVSYVSKENFLGHSNKLRYIFWFWNRLFLLKTPTHHFLISTMKNIILLFLKILQFHSFLILIYLSFCNVNISISGASMVTEANMQSCRAKERPNSPLGLPRELPPLQGLLRVQYAWNKHSILYYASCFPDCCSPALHH